MTNVARTGQTLLIVASSMFFAAFTSAMVVRRGLGGDWVAPALPGWIWWTVLLGPLSAWFIQHSRRAPAVAAGSLLVVAQVAVVASLRMDRIGEAFLAVLVSAHALHAAAGVAALLRFGPPSSLYWQFVGALWCYLLVVFGVWA